ncbi:phosphatidate cytidylyltransferase [Fulvitalea axinellae]|uniref:Phosphatidate cytidylyltransferase n=1 Tax=Fulvitalea axinellae TaxID=1182444 RepID=A0AAU9CRI6_9BACT|nr:phosphatidate cytidylyltransferase [Fulvitalea axinellae]
MLSKYSNMTQRTVAGLIGILVILGAIFWSAWSFFFLFLFICVMAQQEFYKLAGIDGQVPLKTYGTFCGAVLFASTFLVSKGIIPDKSYYLIFPLMSVTYLVKLYTKGEKKPFTNIAYNFTGILYVALPFALLNIAAFQTGEYSHQVIIGVLFLLWASDTGAYFAGVNFGKRKLFVRVSPKKSWEGFFGGAILSLVTSYVVSLYFKELSSVEWLGMSVIIIIAGTYGDLIESLLKRSVSIKDSASTIPGHGGFLDRFDGLLFASPWIVAYLKFVCA